MNIYYFFVGALIIQSAMHLFVSVLHRNQWIKLLERRERSWLEERKDLLDRIQAPSFAEYTAKVIREKKAEKPQEEEKPVEFIS